MRTMSKPYLYALSLLAASACAKAPPGPPVHDTSINPGYHVVGNQVLDKTGTAHYFHGVDRSTLEATLQGQNISAGDFRLMAGWHANTVRIALGQDLWLFGDSAVAYRNNVLRAVEWAKQAGLDVILDLHWSDQGKPGGGSPGQQKMADTNSIEFWKSVADFYKDDGRVLFELYNEPHDISWDVWLNGGDAGGFTAVGMQQLYDTVRATGAMNIVIAGGLDWAFDLSGVASHRIQGQNIMYATHPYDRNNWKPVSSFDARWGFLTATDPVIVSEFGSYDCSTDYTSQLIDYSDRVGAHWTAWAWIVGGCAYPSLITDWAGTPSAPGQIVKDALGRYAKQGMPVTQDGGINGPKLDTAGPELPPAVDLGGIDLGSRIDQGGSVDQATAIDQQPAIDGQMAIDAALGDDAPLPLSLDGPTIDAASSEAGGID
jgi:endoglucanase